MRESQRVFANEVRPKLATVHHDTAKRGIWVDLTLKLHKSVTSIVPPLITLPCKNQHWLKTHTPMHLQNPGFLPHSHIHHLQQVYLAGMFASHLLRLEKESTPSGPIVSLSLDPLYTARSCRILVATVLLVPRLKYANCGGAGAAGGGRGGVVVVVVVVAVSSLW